MSTDGNSIVHDTGASETAEEIDLRIEASPEALGAEEDSDSGAGPPLERIILDPEAAGDDEVAITIEWRLEGVSVESLLELVPELKAPLGDNTAFNRLTFDVQQGDEDEIGVALHGRVEETDSPFDSETSPLQRIIIDPENE